jgi:hypothetical protein
LHGTAAKAPWDGLRMSTPFVIFHNYTPSSGYLLPRRIADGRMEVSRPLGCFSQRPNMVRKSMVLWCEVNSFETQFSFRPCSCLLLCVVDPNKAGDVHKQPAIRNIVLSGAHHKPNQWGCCSLVLCALCSVQCAVCSVHNMWNVPCTVCIRFAQCAVCIAVLPLCAWKLSIDTYPGGCALHCV